jgi:hypothetical protein
MIFSSPAGISLTKLSLTGNYKLFPPRKSLVSDIPGDGKIANIFFTVYGNSNMTQRYFGKVVFLFKVG